jgi:4'-phosphopantetheinyl transferase EntD
MAITITFPRPTGGLSPADFTAIAGIMRDTDMADAGIDAEKSESSRMVLADRPADDDAFTELEAYNRSLQYTLLINAYLLGREAVVGPDVDLP